MQGRMFHHAGIGKVKRVRFRSAVIVCTDNALGMEDILLHGNVGERDRDIHLDIGKVFTTFEQ